MSLLGEYLLEPLSILEDYLHDISAEGSDEDLAGGQEELKNVRVNQLYKAKKIFANELMNIIKELKEVFKELGKEKIE
jgi:hypothetical protein